MIMSLPFSSQAKQLRISSIFRQTVSSKHNIQIMMGWSVKLNTMRRLYGLNWTHVDVVADSLCVQGMGLG